MTEARIVEYRITQQLLQQRAGAAARTPMYRIAERFICSAALAGVMLLFGSLLPELLAVLLAATAVLALGTRSG